MRALPLTLLSTGAVVLGLTAGLPDAFDAMAAEQVGASATTDKKSTGKLLVTREDGTRFTIRSRGLKVRCGPLETEPAVRGIKLTNLRADDDGSHLERPILIVEAELAKVREGIRVNFPAKGDLGDPATGVLYLADPDVERDEVEPNELSSLDEDSSGEMFIRGKCGKNPRLKIKVNATLGSEIDDSPSVRVRGTLVGRG
ncbi:MAG: hypothetical protein ACT4P1_03305 [Sporichthyaceae bacterium]